MLLETKEQVLAYYPKLLPELIREHRGALARHVNDLIDLAVTEQIGQYEKSLFVSAEARDEIRRKRAADVYHERAIIDALERHQEVALIPPDWLLQDLDQLLRK